jgi:hypothetical protein
MGAELSWDGKALGITEKQQPLNLIGPHNAQGAQQESSHRAGGVVEHAPAAPTHGPLSTRRTAHGTDLHTRPLSLAGRADRRGIREAIFLGLIGGRCSN